nr:AgmX/PglI C-terminal domain-containing protein [Pyxidicoccus fallax]
MGTPGTAAGGPLQGAALSVSEVLDTDLDAYLDRELFVGPKARPEPGDSEPVSTASDNMRELLDLAEQESEWLETLPASASTEVAPEPEAPEVVIPEWMRVAPGAKETVPFAAMLAPVVHDAVDMNPEAPRQDAASPPTTPWSVPVSHGGLLPGIPLPPPPSMAVQGAMLPPWAPQHAVPPQPWGMPMAVAPEPTRIAGMKPGAFVGAAAVGALAAGLLVVAGLHLHERMTGAQGTAMVASHASGTLALRGQGPDSRMQAGTSGASNSGLASTEGQPGAQGGAPWFQRWTGTSQTGGMSGARSAQSTNSTVPPWGTQASAPSGVQQAAASIAGTVMATAQGDVQGAANSLTAPRSAQEPASAPAIESTTPASGTPGVVAMRETSTRKSLAKTPRAVPANTADDTSEEANTAASEVSFDEASADEESTSTASAEDGDTQVAASETEAQPRNEYSELDEDFARELGFTEDAEKKQAVDANASRTVYVPPAPDVKQHLTPDDVKAVVVSNQPAITACIRQHAKGTPVEGGGRFMVRWSVLPSGDTSGVAMDTDSLRTTPLALCIEDVVRRWKFPVHQVRLEEPIRFPFVF